VKPFKQPPSTYKIPGGSVTVGGPHLVMPIGNGKTVTFEMHSYWGACPKTKTGTDMLRVPTAFLDAFERWKLGGQMVDGDPHHGQWPNLTEACASVHDAHVRIIQAETDEHTVLRGDL
jgi:hypothetical protein